MAAATDGIVPALRVAVLGCGVVGTEVVRLLTTQADDLAARVGAPLELIGIAVRDLEAERDPAIDRSLLTTDAEDLVSRADIVPGDLVATPVTGAYGRSMASNYNSVPRPPVLAVRAGTVRVLVRRETEEDLLALDIG